MGCVRAALAVVAAAAVLCAATESGAVIQKGTVSDLAAILRIEDRRESVRQLEPYLEALAHKVRARAALAVGRIAGPAAPGHDPEARAALDLRRAVPGGRRAVPGARPNRSRAMASTRPTSPCFRAAGSS